MQRRLFAALTLCLALCAGFLAAGWSSSGLAAHGLEVSALCASPAPAAPGVLSSDADDHALLDDRDNLPDPLELRIQTGAQASHPAGNVPAPLTQTLSAVVTPPHRPPKTSGFIA